MILNPGLGTACGDGEGDFPSQSDVIATYAGIIRPNYSWFTVKRKSKNFFIYIMSDVSTNHRNRYGAVVDGASMTIGSTVPVNTDDGTNVLVDWQRDDTIRVRYGSGVSNAVILVFITFYK